MRKMTVHDRDVVLVAHLHGVPDSVTSGVLGKHRSTVARHRREMMKLEVDPPLPFVVEDILERLREASE